MGDLSCHRPTMVSMFCMHHTCQSQCRCKVHQERHGCGKAQDVQCSGVLAYTLGGEGESSETEGRKEDLRCEI